VSRSFGLVDTKLEEAEFFFLKFLKSGWEIREAQFFFNAFVSSTRSVTFAVQASMKGIEGYEEWYSEWQRRLRRSRLARFFHNCRTDIQHVGKNYVNGGMTGPDGPILLLADGSFEKFEKVPERNAFLATENYLKIVCCLVRDAYERFGHLIDPDVFYSLEGMRLNGLSFDEIEGELGLPIGWTSLGGAQGITDEDRMSLLRRAAAISNGRELLARYPEPSAEVWT
jgi:hypothetical protein